MANAWYAAGKEGFAQAAVNWNSDTIHVTAIDAADYTVSLSTHDFYNDVAAAARIATAALASKTSVAGVLDAADTTLTSVTGDQFEALVIWKNTGTESTSRLLIYLDSGSGLPLTPNTGNVLIQWAAGGIAPIGA